MVGRGVVAHRLGQPPLHFEPIVRLRHQVGDAVLRKEIARHPKGRRLVRERLRAILAELELLGAGRIGKGAARAFEPAGLVHREQGARSLADDALLHQHLQEAIQRPAEAALLQAAVHPLLQEAIHPDDK